MFFEEVLKKILCNYYNKNNINYINEINNDIIYNSKIIFLSQTPCNIEWTNKIKKQYKLLLIISYCLFLDYNEIKNIFKKLNYILSNNEFIIIKTILENYTIEQEKEMMFSSKIYTGWDKNLGKDVATIRHIISDSYNIYTYKKLKEINKTTIFKSLIEKNNCKLDIINKYMKTNTGLYLLNNIIE